MLENAPAPTLSPGAPGISGPPDTSPGRDPDPQGSIDLPSNKAGTVFPNPWNFDDRELGNRVRELFYRARNARRPLVQQWKRSYQTLNNRAWTPQAEAWMPAPQISQIWPVIFSMVAWMTDQRPSVEVMPSAQPFSPFGDIYQDLAQDMNTLVNASFMNYQLDGEITQMLWDVYTYRIGYLKTQWEPWLADGMGDAAFRRVDPFTIYPDEHGRNTRDIEHITEAKTMSMSAADRAFPGLRKLVAGNYSTEDIDEAPHVLEESVSVHGPRTPLAAPSATSVQWGSSSNGMGVQTYEDPVVTLLETWHRYHKTSPADDGTAKVEDRWWCTVLVNNIVVLSADADDLNAFGSHPYDRMVLSNTGEWYGPGMVELLRSPQSCIARTLASIEQNLALMGNPVLLETTRSDSRSHTIANKPGQRIPIRSQGDVQWLQPPQMNPQIAVELMGFYAAQIDNISGMTALRGAMPNQRNSEGVVDSVQDAAFVRIRATLRELERTLRGAGSKLVATIAEFYTEPRQLAMLGPDGQRLSLVLRSRHFYTRDEQNEDDQLPLRFSLMADAGSQLPTSRQARAAEAERLFAVGAIDVFELLKAKQWPNYAVVAKRVMEQMAAAGSLGQPPGARQRAGRNT